jgi:hypothetical protein
MQNSTGSRSEPRTVSGCGHVVAEITCHVLTSGRFGPYRPDSVCNDNYRRKGAYRNMAAGLASTYMLDLAACQMRDHHRDARERAQAATARARPGRKGLDRLDRRRR